MENSTPPQPSPYDFITQQASPPAAPSPKRKRLLLILALLLFMVAVVAIASYFLTKESSDTPSPAGRDFSVQKFDDPLFSAEMPSNWITMAGYEPGRGVVSFASKATEFVEVDGNTDILMKIAIMPSSLSGPLPTESIQQERFTKGDVSYEIRSVENDGRPDRQVLTVMHAVKNRTTLVATLISPEAYFLQQQKQIYQVLSSITLK